MTNLFEQAVRQQLRFNIGGEIDIEKLYTSYNNVKSLNTLENYANALSIELDKVEKVSTRRRNRTTIKSKAYELNELRLKIIDALIDEIIDNDTIRKEQTANDELRQQALSIKQQRKQEALHTLSDEELDKIINKM